MFRSINTKSFLEKLNVLAGRNYSEGACNGFALMAKQAILARELPLYHERITWLYTHTVPEMLANIEKYKQKETERIRQIKVRLGAPRKLTTEELKLVMSTPWAKEVWDHSQKEMNEALKTSVNKENELRRREQQILFDLYTQILIETEVTTFTDEEKIIRSIMPYLNGVIAYQNLNKLPQLFPEHQEPYMQNNSLANDFVRPLALPQKDQLIYLTTRADNPDALIDFLNTLQEFCEKDQNMPVAITINGPEHIFTITYDPERQRWIIPNFTPPLEMSAAQYMLSIFEYNFSKTTNHFLFVTKIFVRNEDVEKAKQYIKSLENKLDFEFQANEETWKDQAGYSLLSYAAIHGDLPMIKRLLSRKTNINHQIENGHTPLTLAAMYNQPEVVELLLEHGADPNISNSAGMRPIHYSCVNNNESISKQLLDYGAAVNVVTTDGHTPLYCCHLRKNPKLMRLLLEHGGFMHVHPFRSALQVLPGMGIPPSDWKRLAANNVPRFPKALEDAFDSQNQGRVLVELEKLTNLNCVNDDFTVLTRCMYRGYDECVNYLLSRDIDVNLPARNGDFPINHSLLISNVDLLKKALDKGANINQLHKNSGETPLLQAMKAEHNDTIKLLIDRGADLNQADYSGITPIIKAIKKNNLDYLERLLKAGADPNRPDLKGNTPLHIACNVGSSEMVRLLFSYKANPNIKNNAGVSSKENMICIPSPVYLRKQSDQQGFFRGVDRKVSHEILAHSHVNKP